MNRWTALRRAIERSRHEPGVSRGKRRRRAHRRRHLSVPARAHLPGGAGACDAVLRDQRLPVRNGQACDRPPADLRKGPRSEEHTSELQSLMRISYAVFCLKKKTNITKQNIYHTHPITLNYR